MNNNDIIQKANLARTLYEESLKDLSIQVLKDIKHPVIENLIKEINNNDGNRTYLNLPKQSTHDSIAGIFECKYHPYLSLEFAHLLEVIPSLHDKTFFKNIRCVNKIYATDGLLNNQVVAIFPENFKSVLAKESDPVFYFVNKFVERHRTHTSSLIQRLSQKLIFAELLRLPNVKIEALVANWVNIHEQSHRLGAMPIPEFIFEKSTRYTAAMEELRADIVTIRKCFYSYKSKNDDYFLTGLYVLAERLLSYPLFRDKLNFDTISSILFSKYIKKHLLFESNFDVGSIISCLNELLGIIENLENECISKSTKEERRLYLHNGISEIIGDYNDEYRKYLQKWGH